MFVNIFVKFREIERLSIITVLVGFIFLIGAGPSHSEILPPLLCSSIERAACSTKHQVCTSEIETTNYSIFDFERNTAFSDCDKNFENCRQEWMVRRNQFTSLPYPRADRKFLFDIYFLRNSRNSDHVEILQIYTPEVSTENYEFVQSMLGSTTNMIIQGKCRLREKS